jgi:hypothetical protein
LWGFGRYSLAAGSFTVGEMFWRLRDTGLRSHVVIGVAALALVVVDSVVAGSRGSGEAQAQPSIGGHQTPVAVGHGSRAKAVASGHGRIWALVEVGRTGRYFVGEIDPRNDEALDTIRVPGPASYVFYGAGHVWVSGRHGSTARLSAIDPRTGRVLTLRLRGDGALSSMAFAGPTAYAAVVGRDEVLELTARKRLHAKAIEERGGPLAVVAVPHAIEVTNRDMNLVPIILRGADTTFLAALQLGRPVIAAAEGQAAWVRREDSLVRETLSASGRPARHYVPTHALPLEVVMTPAGGCYVAVATHKGRRPSPDLLYFTRAALSAGHPRPTAVHRGRQINHLALDPTGGVVYTDVTGRLNRWAPG